MSTTYTPETLARAFRSGLEETAPYRWVLPGTSEDPTKELLPHGKSVVVWHKSSYPVNSKGHQRSHTSYEAALLAAVTEWECCHVDLKMKATGWANSSNWGASGATLRMAAR